MALCVEHQDLGLAARCGSRVSISSSRSDDVCVTLTHGGQQGLRKTKDKPGFGNDLVERDCFQERVL